MLKDIIIWVVFYINLRKFTEAIASYQQAIKIKPNFTEAYNNLGLAFEDLGKVTEAIDSYQQAIKIKPNFYRSLQ